MGFTSLGFYFQQLVAVLLLSTNLFAAPATFSGDTAFVDKSLCLLDFSLISGASRVAADLKEFCPADCYRLIDLNAAVACRPATTLSQAIEQSDLLTAGLGATILESTILEGRLAIIAVNVLADVIDYIANAPPDCIGSRGPPQLRAAAGTFWAGLLQEMLGSTLINGFTELIGPVAKAAAPVAKKYLKAAKENPTTLVKELIPTLKQIVGDIKGAVGAWKTMIDFPGVRNVPFNLDAVNSFQSAFPNRINELKDAITASTNKDRFFAFLKRTNKIGFGPDESLYAADRAKNVLVGNSYVLNPTRRVSTELHVTPSGKVKLDPNSGDAMNGQYMYVVDEFDNVVIGQRATAPPFNGYAPHPSLIGGENPMVQAAGMVEFRAGKIYKVDNASGHF